MSYDSDFPALPAAYAEQESAVHSVSAVVHPKPIAIKSEVNETPVSRRQPSLCEDVGSSSANSEDDVVFISTSKIPVVTRKRFQESWEDSAANSEVDEIAPSGQQKPAAFQRPPSVLYEHSMRNARTAVTDANP
eukprot:CAMPEP_0172417974 /NCGR_PEP_ID=MMETSP1064-20121228/4477_1 /TAXON_ID=202472 /ORGANISM="Aulacoseira subarctica , Strain CCAP 1002/5" /LENGTH=133 /DNA_ID=CAMNT_0013156595 /DNA_START=64 /DNA_END=462 /DNA_ORIENTATION=+